MKHIKTQSAVRCDKVCKSAVNVQMKSYLCRKGARAVTVRSKPGHMAGVSARLSTSRGGAHTGGVGTGGATVSVGEEH